MTYYLPPSGALPIQDFRNAMLSGNFLIVDVRDRDDYCAYHIVNAINVPLVNILNGKWHPFVETTPTLFYCHSGNRSGQATNYLKAHGYHNVYYLNDLATNWPYHNFPLVYHRC